MTDHRHDMEMTFPDNDLKPMYVCECGVRTPSSTAAIMLQGKSAREEEKKAMFAVRYGASQRTIHELLSDVPAPTLWQRFVWWLRSMRLH